MRRISRILLWTAGVVLALVLAAGLVVETPFFKNWLRGVVVRQANDHLNGTLSIGRLSGNLLSGVELDDVAVSMNNEPVVSIGSVKTSYSIPQLLSGRGVTVKSVTLTRPVVTLHRLGTGWQLAQLVKPGQTKSSSSRPVAVNDITITDASVTIDKAAGPQTVNIPHAVDHLDAHASVAYAPSKTTVRLDRLSLTAADPMLDLKQLSADVAVTPDSINIGHVTMRTAETSVQVSGAIAHYRQTPTFAMQVSFAPLSLPQVHRFVPSVPLMRVAPAIDVKLGGPTTRLATELSVKSDAVHASFKGTVSLGGPDRVYSGEVAVHHLDLAPFLNNPEQKSDISVYAKVDLRGPAGFDTLKGSVAADAPLVSTHGYIVEGIHANAKIDGRTINFDTSELAYKSNTTAAGSVVFATNEHPETRFDLRGVVKDVGIAYLPKNLRVPPAETKLTADYHVHLIIPRTPGWHLDGDVTMAKSTVAGVTIGDGATASFLFEPNVARYQVDMNVLDVNLQRIGRQFAVTSLAAPRYETSLNGHVMAKVDGTALQTMTIDASGSLRDSSLFGGRVPDLHFTAALARDALHVTAKGQLTNVNPGAAAGKRSLDGKVSGTVDANLTLHDLSKGIDPNSIDATVTAELGPSAIGRASIEHASIDGDYRNQFADIQKLEVTGSNIVVSGNGTIALNTTDKSGFWLHAESPDIGAVATTMGQPQRLNGIGTVDAVVSGNKTKFTVTGTATANGFKYDKYGALSASTSFTATVPDLDAQKASVTADTHATFVDLPGLQVNDLTAKTTYTNKNLDFDVTATQPKRSLTAAGLLVIHTDRDEVHLRGLTFETQGMTWKTTAEHQAAFQWGGQGIAVHDFVLANGAQQIRADGVFGAPGKTLTVALDDVNLGIVDAWLLRPPQLAGTVSAKADISGTTKALRASAGFTVENGKFRQVPFDWFSGTVKYSPAAIDVDAKLQQNATQWLTAKGELPMSLLRGDKQSADRVNFHVDSSAIDLGLVQGFTSALTNVKGALQAKLDLTGTAADPRAAGSIAIQNGTLKVQPTGV
ncbi:MAG TPA: translocation/assembly module TamB domain-containing protein, partial [Vicinamibacterales bacterium]|nr:translocation/assembly module TamB domain-containing protein [Vicinamibacterales bacterium]